VGKKYGSKLTRDWFFFFAFIFYLFFFERRMQAKKKKRRTSPWLIFEPYFYPHYIVVVNNATMPTIDDVFSIFEDESQLSGMIYNHSETTTSSDHNTNNL